MSTVPRYCMLMIGLLLGSNAALAQWTSQTITLRPGWNAVFLEVQPEPRECDTLFTNVPVESVWMWNRRFNPVQFVQDPNQLIIGQPDWLTYVPTNNPGRPAMNLFSLLGGRTYLIKLAGGLNRSWVIQGRPAIRKTEWLSDSLNFVGFPLDPASPPPTFQSFFAGSPAHAGQAVYRLSASGIWTNTPASSTLTRGEAFWIRTVGQSTFSGPLSVEFEQGNGVDYGRILTEQTFRIRNTSTTSRTIRVRRLASAMPPSGTNYPAWAGDVPLSYFVMNLATTNIGWVTLPDPLSNVVATNRDWALRLEVRRIAMANPPAGAVNGLYQSLLEVTDGAGSRLLVPVTANGLQTSTAAAGVTTRARGLRPASAGGDPHRHAGLWVGSVTITNVSQPASFSPTNPQPTASPFQFRLIIHVDESGQAAMMQKVLQMWKNGTYKPAGDGTTNRMVDQPGRYVLVTDDRLIPNFTNAGLGLRFSSAAFGFRNPLPMSSVGDFGADAAILSCLVLLDYNDELNPFKHRYHPDHNNLDEGYQPLSLRTNGFGQVHTAESWTITRQIELQFTATNSLRLAGWGDNQLGGIYRETITGLHKDLIYLLGSFRLHHASRIGVLNDSR